MAYELNIEDIDLINQALARIGSKPLQSPDDESKLAAQVKQIYEPRILGFLQMHAWWWAQKTYKLTRLNGTPENGWPYQFELPGDRIGPPHRVMAEPRSPAAPLRNYWLEGGWLYAARDPLWVTVTVRANPTVWDAAAREAFVCSLAAHLCIPVTQHADLGAELQKVAEGTPSEGGRGGLVGRAIAADAAGHPVQTPLWDDPLTRARWE